MESRLYNLILSVEKLSINNYSLSAIWIINMYRFFLINNYIYLDY